MYSYFTNNNGKIWFANLAKRSSLCAERQIFDGIFRKDIEFGQRQVEEMLKT